jgi:hypothetical protein
MLKIEVYPDAEALAEDTPTEFQADFLSLVNHGTYGPPALIAPAPGRNSTEGPVAQVGETVLYINTSLVPAFKGTRIQDRQAR